MAQNIAIQEGNQGKQFGHINKLKISNQGGGTSLWVPEDEVRTKSLYVSENGTYLASKDEVYGYDEVTVNITKEVIGWKYDEDTGELDGYYDIEVDDDDFFIEDDEGEIGEELPTSIKVVVPPDKTEYIAYEPINTKGMVVMGYYADGSEYGEIPREEYTIDPLVAVKGSGSEKWSDGDGINAIKVTFGVNTVEAPDGTEGTNVIWNHRSVGRVSNTNVGTRVGYFYLSISGKNTGSYQVYLTKWNGRVWAAAEEPCNGITRYYSALSYNDTYYWYKGMHSGQVGEVFQGFQSDGTQDGDGVVWSGIPESTKDPSRVNINKLEPVGNEITVNWIRPQDEEVLSDTFEITVTDPPIPPIPPVEGDDSGGGSSVGEDPEHPITPHI